MKIIGRFLQTWFLLAILLVGVSTGGVCDEVYLVFPETQEEEEEDQNALGSSGKVTKTDNATRPYLRESSSAEIEKAWTTVKKPIYITTTREPYSKDQSAVDAFMNGFVRRVTATNEFEVSYIYAKLDKEGDHPNPSYMLNMLMDKAKDGLYYGHISISRIYRICRCRDGFESRLSEEVPFSANIFCDYSFSRLVELGEQYAEQTYKAIERDLLRQMGFFWYTDERKLLEGANSFQLRTED
jgi:hypothetical protein